MDRFILAALLLSAAPAAPAAQAAIVVDQDALVAPAQSVRGATTGVIAGQNGRPNFINQLVQTVTAGVTGRLSGIDLQIGGARGTGGVNFYLFDGDGTQPGARLLTSEYIALETLPGGIAAAVANPLFIDLAALRYRVAPGQIFSFAVGPANPLDEPGTVALATGSGPAGATPPPNAYAGGTLSVTVNFASYIPASGDAGFRTWVDTAAAVPEPAGWALMIGGFGLVGGAVRRRGAGQMLRA